MSNWEKDSVMIPSKYSYALLNPKVRSMNPEWEGMVSTLCPQLVVKKHAGMRKRTLNTRDKGVEGGETQIKSKAFII